MLSHLRLIFQTKFFYPLESIVLNIYVCDIGVQRYRDVKIKICCNGSIP